MPEMGAFRFLYLNAYAFLLLFFSVLSFSVRLYRISFLFLFLQIPAGIICLYYSVKLFATWNDKKRKYAVLMAKNHHEFREETFEVFMQAPCGRLLVKTVLRDLKIPQRYRELLKYRKTLLETFKSNNTPQKTIVYINKDNL